MCQMRSYGFSASEVPGVTRARVETMQVFLTVVMQTKTIFRKLSAKLIFYQYFQKNVCGLNI